MFYVEHAHRNHRNRPPTRAESSNRPMEALITFFAGVVLGAALAAIVAITTNRAPRR